MLGGEIGGPAHITGNRERHDFDELALATRPVCREPRRVLNEA